MVFCFLILEGCGYFHHYHQPNVAVNTHWTVKDRYIETTHDKNLPYLAWWRGFNDPTLNDLIERGLRCNNSLNMSKGHIDAAAGELKKVRYQWIPNLDVVLGYSKYPGTGFPGVLALIVPSYMMNVFYQIKQQRQAKYALEQVKAEDDAVKLIVISQISASYFTYLAEVERQQLLQVLANDITQLAKIARRVYKDGLSSEINPQELDSQVNMIMGELDVIDQNIIVSRNAIRYLIDENPGEIKTTVKFMDLNNHQLILGELPLTVLENRPDMQMATWRLRASNEGIGLAASNLLPSMFLDYLGGVKAGDNLYHFPHKNVFFNNQVVTAPIIRLAVLGEIAKARGLDKVSYYSYIDTLQKALRDTTNALSAHDRFTNKLQQTTHAQQHLAKAYDLNDRLYKRGIQNYVETLKSKVTLDRMNINLNQDKLLQLVTIVTLYQEMAGGYLADKPLLVDAQGVKSHKSKLVYN